MPGASKPEEGEQQTLEDGSRISAEEKRYAELLQHGTSVRRVLSKVVWG